MSNSRRVTVVGAGIIGAACAHFLERLGWQVTVLDRGGFGNGCSRSNCGFVCPSHALPLAAPGAFKEAFRSIFRRDAPLAIRPGFDVSLWSWLLQFARRCNARDMLAAARGIHALLRSSRQLYDELFAGEPLACEWETKGLAFVYRTQGAFHHAEATMRTLRESFAVEANCWPAEELAAREPALLPGLAGAWHFPNDAHLRPDALMRSWRALLESRGVTIREHCEVAGWEANDRRATAVVTQDGPIETDAIVVAAGAWTPQLHRALGTKLPIQPGKGYSITMPRPPRCPSLPLIFEEHRVAATPMQTGYRLGSMMEFTGYDTTIAPSRIEMLRSAARHYLHTPESEPIEETWFGWRPMTYDGLPIIDFAPKFDNVVVAAGHNMLGLSMAPATGRLAAELLNEQPPHVDPKPYSARRF